MKLPKLTAGLQEGSGEGATCGGVVDIWAKDNEKQRFLEYCDIIKLYLK